MSSATQNLPDRARFDYAFTCIDRDGDGRVSRADLDALAATPGACHDGVPGRGPVLTAKVTRALDSFWELLCLCVDATDHVDREGFVLFQRLAGEEVVTFVGQVPPVVHGLVAALLATVDADGDGRLSAEEYATFLRAMGSTMDPAAAFSRLDLDGSGQLDVVELEQLLADYLANPDPGARGAVLLTGGWP